MDKQKKKKHKNSGLWILLLLLFAITAATTMAVTERMNSYLFSDEGAIPLIPDSFFSDQSGAESDTDSSAIDTETDGNQQANAPHTDSAGGSSDNKGTGINGTASDSQPTAPPRNPGFETRDEQKIWSNGSSVNIFSINNTNGTQEVTVASSNGDKVIAPGIENSYVFKLKNTGNVAMDYTVTLDAYITPADITLPITGRLSRYDGEWVVGSPGAYAGVAALDKAEDSDTLGAGKYTYYTFDWVWPFETGDDAADTLLGNLATSQNITFTIAINTYATESDDPYADNGVSVPKTGDNSNVILWAVVAAGAFLLLLLLLLYQRRQDDES